jgi:hypothetical protein
MAGDAEGEGLARPGPANYHRNPLAALADITHHRLLVGAGSWVRGQRIPYRLVGGHGRQLARPTGARGDQPLFDGEQLRGGPAALLQGPVGDHADRPLG